MSEDLKNPYRRALLLATIARCETEGQRIERALLEGLPDYLTHVLDILGVSLSQAIFAAHGGKFRGKHIFKTKKRKEPKSEYFVIDGKIEEIIFG